MAKLHPNVEVMDAWIVLQVNKSNVLMTDIEMPSMNGLSFLSMFSEKLHVIFTSTKMSCRLHAIELGSVNFLSRPFSKTEFNHALKDVHERITRQKY